MSRTSEDPSIELLQMHPVQLQQLCNQEPVDWGAMRVPEGALPSKKSIVRAISHWRAGTPAKWCLPYLIVAPERDLLVGGCGFKGPPVEKSVEIYYGLAPSQRGRGIATRALHRLLQITAIDEGVERVIAHILPQNVPSRRLVERVGFRSERRFMDTDGQDVDEWVWERARGTHRSQK